MNAIHIASTIQRERKGKQMTQEELAGRLGVSKAAVSKWETGQSLPDITMLPQLATLFNITIDELLSYTPQMDKEDIRRLYFKLAADFAKKPLPEVLNQCDDLERDYFACFPLLLQLATLYLNHLELAKKAEDKERMIVTALKLCQRITEESSDYVLTHQAVFITAYLHLMQGDPTAVIDALSSAMTPVSDVRVILSGAYQMKGDAGRADAIVQVAIYNHLAEIMGALPTRLMLVTKEEEAFQMTVERGLAMEKAFDLDHLHVGVMFGFYGAAAQGYLAQKKEAECYAMLDRYAALCRPGVFKSILHGDVFFKDIEPWLADFDLGANAPRDTKTIVASTLSVIRDNPAFTPLKEAPRFKNILAKMEAGLKN